MKKTKKQPACEKVSALHEAPYNPRKITDPQLAALGAAMREFGDLGGIVVNVRTGNTVSGHQRIKKLDPEWKISKQEAYDETGTVARGYVQTPWGRLDYREVDWPEKKEKAANLAANKHGGEFKRDAVKELLRDLDDGAFNMDLTGFLAEERALLMPPDPADGALGVDDAPPAPKNPVSKLGDLWLMGKHRMLVGDSTVQDNWTKICAGFLPAQVVHTDPPYGVSYKAKSGKFEVIENDDKRDDALLKMLVGAFKCLHRVAAPNAAFYIWHASSTRREFEDALTAASLIERQYLIWNKGQIVLGHSDYRWMHEPCFYASKAGERPAFYGDRAQPTVWTAAVSGKSDISVSIGPGVQISDGQGAQIFVVPRIAKGKKIRSVRLADGQCVRLSFDAGIDSTVWEVKRDRDYQHPTQKPVELAKRAIANSSKPGDTVLDAFLGSGTTLIAAELMKRSCYGMELDPQYADVVVARWEKLTGKKAERKSK